MVENNKIHVLTHVDLSEPFSYYAMLSDIQTFQTEYLRNVQAFIDKSVQAIKEDMGTFYLTEESMEDFIRNAGNSGDFVLILCSDKNYSFEIGVLDNDIAHFRITKEVNNNLYVYDPETGAWTKEQEIGWMKKIMEKDDAESQLLDLLASYPLPPFSEKDFKSFVQKNGPILRLYQDLHGLVDIQLIEKKESCGTKPLLDLSDHYLALIPDDPFCSGIAVYYEDGYHICQYLETDELLDALENREEASWFASEDMRLFHTVMVEKNTSNIKQMLRVYLDHYNPGEDVFIFPLSETAYVSTRRPFRKLPVRTSPRKRSLTEVEQKNLTILKTELKKLKGKFFFEC